MMYAVGTFEARTSNVKFAGDVQHLRVTANTITDDRVEEHLELLMDGEVPFARTL